MKAHEYKEGPYGRNYGCAYMNPRPGAVVRCSQTPNYRDHQSLWWRILHPIRKWRT